MHTKCRMPAVYFVGHGAREAVVAGVEVQLDDGCCIIALDVLHVGT
jgi:hypothetical protein